MEQVTSKPDITKKIPHQKMTLGQKCADRITRVVGSWPFILIQSILLLAWIILNITAWINRWDPYPFILLNLALSFQAAYTAPIILMSQNRMAEKDRMKAEADLAVDRKTGRDIQLIIKKLNSLERNKVDRIKKALEENNNNNNNQTL